MATEEVVSPKKFQRFYEHLKSKATGGRIPNCPICNEVNWSNPGFSETPSKIWDSNRVGVLRTIPIICETCGYTIHFSMSLVDESE